MKGRYPEEYHSHPADIEITVKAGSTKAKLCVNSNWPGEFIFRLISSYTRIALGDMKVIVRGKVYTAETISTALSNKTLVMVLGTAVLDSEGVDDKDIEVLMKQMHIDRNRAVTSLKKTGSLVDSMLDVGNS